MVVAETEGRSHRQGVVQSRVDAEVPVEAQVVGVRKPLEILEPRAHRDGLIDVVLVTQKQPRAVSYVGACAGAGAQTNALAAARGTASRKQSLSALLLYPILRSPFIVWRETYMFCVKSH